MKAKALYEKLDKDFDLAHLKDDWSFIRFNDYYAPDFRKCFMGTVLDNTTEIKKVYTATFPDRDILEKLLHTGQTDILLFSHHAMGYDPNIQGFPFYDIPGSYLHRLRQQRISFYVLHAPLDKNGEYSTSVTLARNLDLEIMDEFCEYEGVKVGVICKTPMKNATQLARHVRSRISHEIKLVLHGNEIIREGRVAVAAGGGDVGFVAAELAAQGINLYITGTTRPMPFFEPVMEFHRIVLESKINVIGATHYSTEKYACMAMTGYFKKIGVEAEFLEGRYFLLDL
jgi:putative NIF3 family GTP cyclohydrolase 1 type 2